MSDILKEEVQKIYDYFKDFTCFIELKDFRSFLLFTLNSQAPSNLLAQFGLGGAKDIINLPYNPLFKIYYQKINLLTSGSLTIYVKSNPIKDEFILEKDDPIFKEYLNSNEMSLAFRSKEKFLIPKISDFNSFEKNGEPIKLNIKIDDLFHSLESFIAVLEPNILFVLEAKNPSEPDLIFTFNMMPEISGRLDQNLLKIDVFLDKEHKTKDITYLKREENYQLTFMEDVKEISHADLYKSSFSLVLHVKSLNMPYKK